LVAPRTPDFRQGPGVPVSENSVRFEGLGQLPQALVEGQVNDGVRDGPRAPLSEVETSLDQVLLHPVVHVPEGADAVGLPLGLEDAKDLVILRLAVLADAKDQGVRCELPHVGRAHRDAVPAVDLLNGLAGQLRLLVQQGLDLVVGEARVTLPETTEVVALDDQTVLAHEAEDAELCLQGAGTVVGVEEHHRRVTLDATFGVLDVHLRVLELDDVGTVRGPQGVLALGLLGLGQEPAVAAHLFDDLRGRYEVVPVQVQVLGRCRCEGCGSCDPCGVEGEGRDLAVLLHNCLFEFVTV